MENSYADDLAAFKTGNRLNGRVGNYLPVVWGKLSASQAQGTGNGRLLSEIVLADTLRAGTQSLFETLRGLGIKRIVLATGDRRAVADAIVEGLGIDSIHAGLTPDQKVEIVLAERRSGSVMMVGDGINDAPPLAAADIGVAMGARGTAASAEAADVILLVDHLDRLVPAIQISKRSRKIALESVFAGIGLSLVGMTAAAFGYLSPVQGALIQEAIDVAVILNALRALGGKPLPATKTAIAETEVTA